MEGHRNCFINVKIIDLSVYVTDLESEVLLLLVHIDVLGNITFFTENV